MAVHVLRREEGFLLYLGGLEKRVQFLIQDAGFSGTGSRGYREGVGEFRSVGRTYTVGYTTMAFKCVSYKKVIHDQHSQT